MRFPGTRHLQHAGRDKRTGGAIIENDAELVLPPVIQPVVNLGLPVANVAAADADGSLYGFHSQFRNGAGVAANADSGLFNAGSWLFEGAICCTFTGTTAIQLVQVFLVDPTANQVQLAGFHLMNGLQAVVPFERTFHLLSNGWFFRIASPVLVAGDILFTTISFNRHRLF